MNAPRWDTTSIFSSFSGSDYQNALKTVDSSTKEMQKALNSPQLSEDFKTWLKSFIDIFNKTFSLFDSMYAYAQALSTVDTNDTSILHEISKLDDLLLPLTDVENLFTKTVADNADKLPEFFKAYPEMEKYRFILNEYIEEYSHLMTPAEENLAQDLQRTGAGAWSHLQETIIANLVDAETGKTFNELRTGAHSADPEIRRDSYNREIALLKQSEIPLAACMNNVKGATLTLNKRRNWKKPIDKSLCSSRISEKTHAALIGALEDAVSLWQEYLQVRARLLGYKDALPFYDLFAPLPKPEGAESEKAWTYDEARAYIIERYTGFSQNLGNFVKNAFDKNWIDAEIRKGKVGGAYCTSFPTQKESRVLANFNGNFDDVITLAHELGHAYHHECIKDEDFLLQSYPMTLAETASTFGETIVMKDMLSKAKGFEKARLCDIHLNDGCQVLCDILSRYYLEAEVFNRREKGDLSPQELCDIMVDAQNRTYGAGLTEVKHPYLWALKCHYYFTDLDFYNYPYAFGQLFALSLYSKFEKEGAAFPPVYMKLLKDTGCMNCEDVCRSAGFDIESKDFWNEGIAQYRKELEILKEYADSL
ncbi:MAG: M3 family oligoendopeptidase [Treponema sp.]|nr:M3 family oligoendopeptidase [Candidatus Treponema caballi]